MSDMQAPVSRGVWRNAWQQVPGAATRLHRWAENLSGFLFLMMFLVFVVQIVARGVFRHPLPWSDEAAVVLYLWVIIGATAWVVPNAEQVQFDLLWNVAGPRQRRLMQGLGHGLVGVLSVIALPATWDYVHFMAREGTPVLGIPFMWVFLPLVMLVVALVLRSALGLLQVLGGMGENAA